MQADVSVNGKEYLFGGVKVKEDCRLGDSVTVM